MTDRFLDDHINRPPCRWLEDDFAVQVGALASERAQVHDAARLGCVAARWKVTLPPRERGGICTLGCVAARWKVTLPPRERVGFCTPGRVVVRR